MDTKKYWTKQKMDERLLKNFCHVFNHKKAQIKVRARINRMVPPEEIIIDSLDGVKFYYYGMYKEVMDMYVKKGRKADYTKTVLWSHEKDLAPKSDKGQVRRRFASFFKLFDSISKKGYKRQSNKMVRMIDIEGKERTNDVRGERFSEKYYRINGRKRSMIAKYLGIKTIPCRVLKIRIAQL